MTQTVDRSEQQAPQPDEEPAPKHRRARRPIRIPRVPTVMQMESVECGAASLAMILAYHGKYVALEQLRELCGVSRDGAKASTMLNAARSLGLVAKGVQGEAEVLREMTEPVIIFWAFQHFMVVEGIRKRFGRTQLRINDPAAGQRWMDWAEFDTGFTGIILQFEKGPDFEPSGSEARVTSALFARRLSTGRALPLVLLASLLLTLPGILAPAYSKVFIDAVLGAGQSSYALGLVVAMLATAAIVFVLTSVQQHYLLRIEVRLALLSSARFMRHLLRLPINFFMQRRPAEVARRVSSNDVVAEILSRDLAQSVINLALVAFYAVILFRDDHLLAAVGVGMAALNILVLRWVSRVRTDAVVTLRADRGNLTAATFTTLSLIETVKATGAEADAFNRWAGFLAKVTSGRQRLGVPTAVLVVVPPLLAAANSGLILLIGGLRVVDGAITVGLLVSFQTLLSAMTRPVQQLTNLGSRLQDVTADIKRLYDVERYPTDPMFESSDDQTQTAKLDGYLEMRAVSFAYSPLSPPVVEDVSLTVAPGRRIAIVGGSGSGKSTIGRLLNGLYQPTSGTILLDGKPRSEISRAVLAASVSYVDQDISFFEATVRDNLTLWDPEVSDEAIIAALEDAEIFDVVGSRPGGINSMILEDGRNYSGGQRQRLDLARALAGQPSVLVLDEATSALDPETERLIMDNLRRRGCACITVAHRLSTIRDADEIIVLDHGKVVERGRHEQLLAAGGVYAELIESGDMNADADSLEATP